MSLNTEIDREKKKRLSEISTKAKNIIRACVTLQKLACQQSTSLTWLLCRPPNQVNHFIGDKSSKLKLETNRVAELPRSEASPCTACKTCRPWISSYYCSYDVAFSLICGFLTVLLPVLNVIFHFLEDLLPRFCPLGKMEESWQIKICSCRFPFLELLKILP